jgi:outer membrane receptor protein involved in Fe transport
VVRETTSYNLHVTYRIGAQNRWLNQTSLRIGVNNLFNLEPPLSADSRGYEPSVHNSLARGRSYSLQVTKKL